MLHGVWPKMRGHEISSDITPLVGSARGSLNE